LAEQLRRDLLESEVGDVRRPERGEARSGAKGDLLAWAELVVTLTGGLPTLVAVIRAWAQRGSGRRVTLELDGDKLEVSGASSEQQERLINSWLQRHVHQDA
jgi:Effector Associated Constant Component 1